MTIAAFAGGGRSEAPPSGAPARPASGDRGAVVFVQQGCGSCHTFAPANARGGLGPDLALSLYGKSRDYVLESIVLPNKVIASNWAGGMMPEDFARRIAPGDLDPLVAYLMRGARD
jgi:mono/diheme cytochrome c family protein